MPEFRDAARSRCATRSASSAMLDARERQYVEVYRGILGFAYLILAH